MANSAVIVDFYRPVSDGRLAKEIVLNVFGLTDRVVYELELLEASCHMTVATLGARGYNLVLYDGHNPVLHPNHTRSLVFIRSDDSSTAI